MSAYRISQEALTNTLKHAGPTPCWCHRPLLRRGGPSRAGRRRPGAAPAGPRISWPSARRPSPGPCGHQPALTPIRPRRRRGQHRRQRSSPSLAHGRPVVANRRAETTTHWVSDKTDADIPPFRSPSGEWAVSFNGSSPMTTASAPSSASMTRQPRSTPGPSAPCWTPSAGTKAFAGSKGLSRSWLPTGPTQAGCGWPATTNPFTSGARRISGCWRWPARLPTAARGTTPAELQAQGGWGDPSSAQVYFHQSPAAAVLPAALDLDGETPPAR